jgi:hypothetical protein
MDVFLIEAKIDCTVNMMANIISLDPDSDKLRLLPKFGETFSPHETIIDDATLKY